MSFAEIYPITRLPRRFGVFDYLCEDEIRAGDLVYIPFKGRRILGLVRQKKSVSGTRKKLAKVECAYLQGMFGTDDIRRVEELAQMIVQSPSTLLYQALLGIERKPAVVTRPTTSVRASVSSETAEYVRKAATQKETFVQGSIETMIALSFLLAKPGTNVNKQQKGQLLIIAPHESDAIAIASHLPKSACVALLHGHTPHNQRSHIIRDWHEGRIDILVGTKQASLLPARQLKTVLVFDPTHQDHFQYDRNPRFDAVHAASDLARQHTARFFTCGTTPRINEQPEPFSEVQTAISVIDLNAQDQKTKIPFLSETLQQRITDALDQKKRAIVLYNKKGYAKRLQCKDCGHIPFCGTCGAVPKAREEDLLCPVCHTEMWIPKDCPACGGEHLQPRGIGNQRLVEAWKKAFPTASIALVDQQQHSTLDADILIVTEFFFSTIHRAFTSWNVGVVADACADLHIGQSADANLQAASRLHRLALFAKQQRANCLVQTWTPTFVKPMTLLQEFITSEREIRRTYGLPPFAYRIAIHVRGIGTDTTQTTPLRALLDCAQQNGIPVFEMNNSIEILTPPEKYHILLPQLQALPDTCILNILYE